MKRALILVDLQPDFMPGGTLAVPDGNTLVPVANTLAARSDLYDYVVATQDFHPPEHKSFASNHPGKSVYDMIDLNGLPQVLWPDHCVEGTPGAALHPGLDFTKIHAVIQKGRNPSVDSYSGFLDNDKQSATGLEVQLKEWGVTDIDVMGLAGDYCVSATAIDGCAAGFHVRLLAFATRSVNLQPDDEAKAYARVEAAGGTILHTLDPNLPST